MWLVVPFCLHRVKSTSGPFRIRTLFLAKPDLGDPNGSHQEWRAEARSLWGMPGGLGIASAIEPAGGVSPLRGGVEGCGVLSYRQGVTLNYRS